MQGTLKLFCWKEWCCTGLMLLLGAALSCPAVCAAESASPAGDMWFPVGEEIKYHIYWGLIPVGSSVARTQWIEEDGRNLISIRFRTKTNKFMNRIYPVDDIIESVVDPETFLPIRFSKNLSEGRYRCNEVTTFDHAAGKAYWHSHTRDRSKEYEIMEDTRDIVSFMYYTRGQTFEVGKNYEFRVMADEKLYDLHVKVRGREKVETVDGKKIRSLLIEPTAEFEGLFVRKGKMWLWISEEHPSVLTRMAAKVPVASIKLVLAEIRKSRHDDNRLHRESEGKRDDGESSEMGGPEGRTAL